MRGGPPGFPGMPGMPGIPGGFGGGGATGFVGGPGMPGMPGTGNQPATPYNLGPDDYVTAVVPIKDLKQVTPGFRWGKGPDGRAENVGVAGHYVIQTKYGHTYIDANQQEIILDYKGVENGRDRFPDPKKQFEVKRRDNRNYGSPEGQVLLVEWCLTVGLLDEATAILDRLVARPDKDTFKGSTKAAVEAYAKIKDVLAANLERMDKANQWKDRLAYQAVSVSKHYAIVHQENTQDSANRRLDALENNLRTVYLWFALRGRALPAPAEKMVAVIVGDATEYRRYRDTFEAQNLAADGFHARRENLAVFSGRRLDRASVNFEQLVKDVYRSSRPEDLAKPKLPNLKDNPSAPQTYAKYARASTLALVDHLLQEEAEIAAATSEGTKQLFAEVGLLPRNVLAPEWVRVGIGALFEMPKGPFPGGAGQLKVALHPGGGGPHWAYMRYFEELREKGVVTAGNAPDVFMDTVMDEHYRRARRVEQAQRAAAKKGEEGDSKETPAEDMFARARTYSWAVMYFLFKEKFRAFEAFLVELSKLPRDAELDADAVIVAFAKAYGLDTAGLGASSVNLGRFAGVGLEWFNFMAKQTSPSRAFKIDDLAVTPGTGEGGPAGFPGAPGGPPGFPGAPGGPPGFPGAPGGPPGGSPG
jgi:hypothetical protein